MASSSARRIVVEFLGDDKSLGKTAGQLEGKTSKLGSTFGKVGKAAALGLGAGLVAAGAAAVSFVKAAAEDQASAAKLALALKNTTGATDEQVASVEDWITKQSLATGVADDELRPALGRLAQATGDVQKAQDLLTLAQDVSAGTGKSLEAVSTALMKAQNGQVTSLSRLGIKTTDAKGETLSFHDAVKQMSDTFGGQAAAKADTFQGKMDRLNVMFNEAKESIGYKLLPIVMDLADVFTDDVVPALQKAADWFQLHIQPAIEEFAKVAQAKIAEAAAYIRDHMDEIKAFIAGVLDTITTIWNKWGDDVFTVVKVAFRLIWSQIKGAFQVIKGLFEVIRGVLHGDWGLVWKGIKDILGGALTSLKGMLRAGLDVLKEIFKLAGEALKAIMRGIWEGIKSIAANLAGDLVEAVRSIPGKLKALGDLFAGAGKSLIGAFVNGMKNMPDLVASIAGNVWDAVKGLINSAIDGINDALEFTIDIPGPKNVGVNPPDIPHLASGGIASGLALVGEHGPELVGFPDGSRVFSATRSAQLAAGGQGITINVYGALDPDSVARQIEQVLARRVRTMGGRPLAFQV